MGLEYPYGHYAISVKDDAGQKNVFWNVQIQNRKRNNKTLTSNLTKIYAKNESGQAMPQDTNINVYSMTEDDQGYYYKNKKIKSFKIAANGYAQVMLAPNPYLFIVSANSLEYGAALYTENGKTQTVTINVNSNSEVVDGKKYKLNEPSVSSPLADKLKGYILLQVEEYGEAWYVDIDTKRRYYMEDGAIAYQMMRDFGLGITNENLKKLPVGINDRFEEFDYDGDGVHDKMEEALGSDMHDEDSDGDGFDDGVEVKNGYNPTGSGKMPIDANLSEKLKGRIMLQVESRGEAWYINPDDGRRYYMKDGDSAYEIMRFLSLGITNENLEKIEAGSL